MAKPKSVSFRMALGLLEVYRRFSGYREGDRRTDSNAAEPVRRAAIPASPHPFNDHLSPSIDTPSGASMRVARCLPLGAYRVLGDKRRAQRTANKHHGDTETKGVTVWR